MIKGWAIRVLTVYSKTIYFGDKGAQRGIVPDYPQLFEKKLNKKMTVEKKLKHKHLKL